MAQSCRLGAARLHPVTQLARLREIPQELRPPPTPFGSTLGITRGITLGRAADASGGDLLRLTVGGRFGVRASGGRSRRARYPTGLTYLTYLTGLAGGLPRRAPAGGRSWR
ncbi:hypothetical protein G5C60_18335 [Streptomyces sp. HC44]|uniref:Uncharacterized protein n=1 Tax=Streptomyces scabichelini TaxID=2711217 RepID=A0A6G4V6P4_9ACTN|nr:hypothetical protein [Streptomyces scabichelini]NGO09504.1 hypothetical protein [Streptomyces scabichelini]